jgi:hypothetical protein
MRAFLLFVFYIASCLSVSADSLSLGEDLKLRLVSVEKENEVAFITDYSSSSTIGIYLYRSESFDFFRFCDDNEFSVWSNGGLLQGDGNCFQISYESLFDEGVMDTLFLSFYSKSRFLAPTTGLYSKAKNDVNLKYEVKSRLKQTAQGWLQTSIIILICLFALMKLLLPAQFAYFLTVGGLSERSEGRIAEVNLDSFLSIIFLSFLVSFNYLFVKLFQGQYSGETTLSLHWTWLKLGWVVFLAIVLKYLVIMALARLNAFKKIGVDQVLEFVRFMSLASLVLMIGLQLVYWLRFYSTLEFGNFVGYFYLIVYILHLVYLFVKISSATRAKKLHIISYLCTTEFIGAFLIALIIH